MIKILGKTSPETPSDANLAPRASWEPLGLDFGANLEPFGFPKSIQKQIKTEAEF